MSLAIRLMPETVRSAAFGVIGAAYVGMGTAMTRPIRIFMVQNLTDASVMVSFDGVHDHFPLEAHGYLLLDITSNKTITQVFFLAEGQHIYVRRLAPAVAPTVGAVYLTTFYGAEL